VERILMRLSIWKCTILALYVFVFCSLSFGAFVKTNDIMIVSFFSALILLGLAGLSDTIKTSGANILNFVFWLYHTFFFLLPALIQYTSRNYPFPGNYPDDLVLYVLILVSIALLFYTFGYSLGVGYTVRILKGYRFSKGIIRPDMATLLLIFLMVLPSIFLIYLLGVHFFFQSRDDLSAAIYRVSSTVAMLYNSSKFLAFSSLVLIISALINYGAKKILCLKGMLCIFILLFVVSANFIINNPTSNPRFVFLGMLLALFFNQFAPISSKGKTAMLFFSVSFIFVLFPVIKKIWSINYILNALSTPLSIYLTRADFDGFQQLMNVVRLTESRGYELGYNFLSVILFFVPRAIWPEKAIHTGALAAKNAGYDYLNVSAPFISEVFVSFGTFGVALGFFALGIFFKKLDSVFNFDFKIGLVTYRRSLIIVFAGFLFIVLRGALNAVFPPIAVSLLGLFGVWLASGLYSGKKIHCCPK
jgi:hypothetical protein